MKTKRTQGRSICDRQKKQDSKICGVASGAFSKFWGGARHKVCGYPKIY